MPQALALVKKKLGSSAVIMHSRPVRQGGFMGIGGKTMFEITAKADDSPAPTRQRSALRNTYGLKANDAYSKQKQDLAEVIAAVSKRNSQAMPIPVGGSSGRASSVTPPSLREPAGRGLFPEQTPPVSRPAASTNEIAIHKDIRDELGELKNLINSMVKEQRKLHAPQMPEKLFDTYLELIQKEVADEIAREMVDEIQKELTGGQAQSIDVIRHKLVGTMQSMVKTCGPIVENMDGSGRVVMMVGPTGVGKTTTIAKVAADMKLRRGKSVGLITIDTYRIGAVDQLRMYAQIIDVPLKVVLSPTELRSAIDEMRQTKDVILIDTAGRSHTDAIKLKELRAYIGSAKPDEIHLVLSGTSNQSSIMNAAEEFGKLGVDRVILTKLDEAISFGVIFSVLRKLDASLSYVTTGQDVPDDIEVAAGGRLARLLLGDEGIKKLEVAV